VKILLGDGLFGLEVLVSSLTPEGTKTSKHFYFSGVSARASATLRHELRPRFSFFTPCQPGRSKPNQRHEPSSWGEGWSLQVPF